MSKTTYLFIFLYLLMTSLAGQTVNISIDAVSAGKTVSPYIFGKNNVLPSTYLSDGSNDEVFKAREAGLRLVRQSGGNNSTKYNWRKKLSSHPDWYNNVYANDWDAAARNLTEQLPGVQGLWSFQLIGKVASNNQNNFGDWNYNRSQWWTGTAQNLAGGGTVNPSGGGKALVDGNPDLYLQDWPADSTVAILDHWFNPANLGYDPSYYRYWNMDNEPEIWNGTHDDVMKQQIPAEEFMQSYFKVAKAARKLYPDIKLAGPVPANEWQWYRYGNDAIPWKGKRYCWLEYFILRIAEEEQASGIRLLDVLDIHYYPSSSDPAQLLQYHRVFFDRDYVYPEANGIKTIEGGWNNALNKEYIFGRCADWLNQYLGTDHGVGFGVTEFGVNSSNANVQAVFYASLLGEFMKQGVEICTPWSWAPGMWETVHLFSRYGFGRFHQAVSSDEAFVSAYPSMTESKDSMTIILVNRHTSVAKNVRIDFNGFIPSNTNAQLMTLSGLPSGETFISHQQNALKHSETAPNLGAYSINLPPLSVSALVISSATTSIENIESGSHKISMFPNPSQGLLTLNTQSWGDELERIEIFSTSGKLVKAFDRKHLPKGNPELNLSDLPDGSYEVRYIGQKFQQTELLMLKK